MLSLNPSIQFLFFDQIKYFILSRRARTRSASLAADTVHTLSPIENFILGGLYVRVQCSVTFVRRLGWHTRLLTWSFVSLHGARAVPKLSPRTRPILSSLQKFACKRCKGKSAGLTRECSKSLGALSNSKKATHNVVLAAVPRVLIITRWFGMCVQRCLSGRGHRWPV